MDKALTTLKLALDWFNSIPSNSWYVLGGLITLSGLTFIIINFVKNHHLKRTGEILAKKLVYFYLTFWSVIMTGVLFVITYGLTLSPFLPFLAAHMPQIMAIATAIYTFNGNKAYVAVTNKLRVWVGKKPAVIPATTPVTSIIQPVETVPAPKPISDFNL